MINVVNLEDFRTPKAKIFTGRERGKQVRNDSKIDEIESNFETVEFIIPDNLFSINPSFFEELFINVVEKLGEKKFYEKFTFTNQGSYNYEKPLKEAISRILREKTALDK
jgi:restriction endonuclease Mrr